MVGLKDYKMKKYVFLVLIFTIHQLINAQYNFNIKESEYDFSKAKNHGFSINIYESNVHDIEKEWKKLMKSWHGKVDEKKHEFFADDVTLKSMGDNSFDTYAYCKEKSDHVEFIASVDLGGAFLNSGAHKDQTNAFKNELKSFAKSSTKEALNKKIKKAEHDFHHLEKELHQLEKDEDKLVHDIESWKNSILDAERSIEKKKNDQELKKVEIQQQDKVIGALNEKVKLLK